MTDNPAHNQKMLYALDEVLMILKNMGVDTECGACMCQAFTGSNGYAHTCGKKSDLIVTVHAGAPGATLRDDEE
jgi:hypothetical protein